MYILGFGSCVCISGPLHVFLGVEWFEVGAELGFEIGLMLVCNECCVTRAVVVVVMLTGYLPEMQSKHFYKADNDDWNRQLFCQDSPSNSFNWSA